MPVTRAMSYLFDAAEIFALAAFVVGIAALARACGA